MAPPVVRAEAEDDDVSVTSSIEEVPDSQLQYTVEDILAKEWSGYHGAACYLVQWTGYPMHEWTWEPVEDQSQSIHDIWSDRQARVSRGVCSRFDPRIWKRALREYWEAKLSHVQTRNRKRRRLGLAPSVRIGDIKAKLEDIELYPDGGKATSELESESLDSDVPLCRTSRASRARATKKAGSTDAGPSSVVVSTTQGTTQQQALLPSPSPPSLPYQQRSPSPSSNAQQANQKKSVQPPPRMPQVRAITKTPSNKDISQKKPLTTSTPPAANKQVWRSTNSQVVAVGKPLPKAANRDGATEASKSQKEVKNARNLPPSGSTAAVELPKRSAVKRPPTADKSPALPPPNQGSGNVFAEGKERRTRKIPDAIDPDKVGGHFKKLQTLNRYHKRAKWKEDAEPSGPVVLHRVSKPGEKLTINTVVAATGSASTPFGAPAWSSETPSSSSADGILRRQSFGAAALTQLLHQEDEQPPIAKRAKTVRFRSPSSLREVKEFESMDLDVEDDDEGLFVGGNPWTGRADSASDGGADMMVPLFDQLVTKTAVFGPPQSRGLQCVFDRITLYKPSQWLADFQSLEVLEFERHCQAKAFGAIYHNIRARSVMTGHVVAHEDKDMLKNVAENLKIGSFGAVCFFGKSAAMVVYPSRDKDWSGLEPLFFEGLDEDVRRTLLRRDSGFEDGDTDDLMEIENVKDVPKFRGYSEASAFLKFVCFETKDTFKPLDLKPAEMSLVGGQLQLHMTEGVRPFLMEKYFGITYAKLLPTDVLTDLSRHNFLIAAPEMTQSNLLRGFLLWLESCNIQCQRFSAHMPGHWATFVQRPSGVVVFHETCLPFIRQFPGIGTLLRAPASAFRFWTICAHPELPLGPGPDPLSDTGGYEEPRQHSDHNARDHNARDHNALSMREVFAAGDACLLTPSFLVSQPQEAVRFIKWFRDRLSKNRASLGLVVPRNFDKYLWELATTIEPPKSRQTWRRDSEDPEKARSRARWELLSLVRQMVHEESVEFPPPFTFSKTDSPWMQIDGFVNPHDEQSLVNWFGLWSLSHAHRFRRFHVIGSKGGIDGVRWRIRVPCYLPNTQNDPDAPYTEHMKLRQQAGSSTAAAAAAAEGHVSGVGALTGTQMDLGALRAALRELELLSLAPPAAYVFVFNRAVGYADIYEAEKMRDPSVEIFETFGNWFKMYKPPLMQKMHKNTFSGVFLTPPENTEPAGPTRFGDYTNWNPWAAAFRPGIMPANYHKTNERKYNECELIIWDPSAVARHGSCNGPVPLSKLLESQRHLIRLVEDEIPRREFSAVFGEPVLHRIWLGGFAEPSDNPASPLHKTLDYVGRIIKDTRYFLPLPRAKMEERGYRLVSTDPVGSNDTESPHAATPAAAATTGSETASPYPKKPLPDMTGGRTQDLHGIVHPPMRTDGLTTASKCSNLLYQNAVAARRNSPHAELLEHRYPPTIQWWHRQKAEGRHFEHVNVNTVDEVMKVVDEARRVERL